MQFVSCLYKYTYLVGLDLIKQRTQRTLSVPEIEELLLISLLLPSAHSHLVPRALRMTMVSLVPAWS